MNSNAIFGVIMKTSLLIILILFFAYSNSDSQRFYFKAFDSITKDQKKLDSIRITSIKYGIDTVINDEMIDLTDFVTSVPSQINYSTMLEGLSSNPFNEQYIFRCNSDNSLCIVSDILGNRMLQTELNKGDFLLNLSGSTAGIYLLNISSPTGSETIKLIKTSEGTNKQVTLVPAGSNDLKVFNIIDSNSIVFFPYKHGYTGDSVKINSWSFNNTIEFQINDLVPGSPWYFTKAEVEIKIHGVIRKTEHYRHGEDTRITYDTLNFHFTDYYVDQVFYEDNDCYIVKSNGNKISLYRNKIYSSGTSDRYILFELNPDMNSFKSINYCNYTFEPDTHYPLLMWESIGIKNLTYNEDEYKLKVEVLGNDAYSNVSWSNWHGWWGSPSLKDSYRFTLPVNDPNFYFKLVLYK